VTQIKGISPQDILDYWFKSLAPEAHFTPDPQVDAAIRERFMPVYEGLKQRMPEDWRRDGHSLLAAIIVLDQFPRNMFRGHALAYATDSRAIALAREGVANGFDKVLTVQERQFFYLPFQHAENPQDQQQSVDLYETLDPDILDWALRHRAVIDRFGRFPSRNEALGRLTTEAEAEFLKENPLGF
jgi:uncharacterized protein (DUF924 family)